MTVSSFCNSPAMFSTATMISMNYTDLMLDNLKQFSRAYQPFHGYICLFLCSFGIFTNALNVVILTRPNMRTSVNLVLAAIAFCDMGTMGSYLIYVTRFHIIQYESVCVSDVYTFAWMSFILFHSLWSILLHSASLWLAVLLAVMRLAVIRRSKFSYKILRPNNVWKWIMYIYTPLGLFCLPIIFTNSIIETTMPSCGDSENNITVTVFTVFPSDLALSHNCLLLKSTLWINGVAFKMLPCMVLFFAIFGLTKTLQKAKLRKQRMFQRKQNTLKSNSINHFSSRTTKMLVAILSIFVITELPQALLATVSGIFTDDIYFKIYPLVGDILDLLSLLNSSVNFLLYCSMSSKFRTVFTKLILPFSCCAKYKRYPPMSMDNDMMSCHNYDSTTVNGFMPLSTSNGLGINVGRAMSAVLSYSPDVATISSLKASVSFTKQC